jgi:hypothetical protein
MAQQGEIVWAPEVWQHDSFRAASARISSIGGESNACGARVAAWRWPTASFEPLPSSTSGGIVLQATGEMPAWDAEVRTCQADFIG